MYLGIVYASHKSIIVMINQPVRKLASHLTIFLPRLQQVRSLEHMQSPGSAKQP